MKVSNTNSIDDFLSAIGFKVLGACLHLLSQDAMTEDKIKPTTIKSSLELLGIENENQQNGVLDLLRLSGNLEKNKIWTAVYKILKFNGYNCDSKNTSEQNENIKGDASLSSFNFTNHWFTNH